MRPGHLLKPRLGKRGAEGDGGMTTTGASIDALSTDLRVGLAFLTRLPFVGATAASGADVARASWTFPVIGIAIGLIGAFVAWLADGLGLHPFISGTLAIAVIVLVTGCLHEDGLADMVDGFGGGGSPMLKLDIMRDSRVGAYGTCALILSFMLRAGALASFADPAFVAPALIAAQAGARATMPTFMRLVPPARQDGLSAEAGKPPQRAALIAALIGFVVLVLCLGFGGGLIAALLVATAIVLLAWLCMSQISGQTGDVLGAVEQVSEVLILLVAAAWL
jgi:adenosylcobinamide-GDP ribazoletransferase